MAFVLNNNETIKENTIIVRNSEGEFELGNVTDEVAQKIYQLVMGIEPKPQTIVVQSPSAPTKKATKVYEPIPSSGKVVYNDNNEIIVVDNSADGAKDYRAYIKCKYSGKQYSVKNAVNECGGYFIGRDNNGKSPKNEKGELQCYWIFPTKKAMNDFVKNQKAYNESKSK